MSLRYSCYMGVLCIGVFTMFGSQLGVSVFRDPDAGTFITILAWLCPFMYLATTLGSVLNGLGKTSITFFQNVLAMLIRLAFVLFAIPVFGIQGYLWGMLASELALAVMCFLAVKGRCPFSGILQHDHKARCPASHLHRHIPGILPCDDIPGPPSPVY